MSYEELRQADEDDRRDWLAAREDEVRAFADEECPVCDGNGYTDGVTVRHPCPNCNPDFRLDRATDRLIEVGTETPVPDAGREGRGEVLTQRESEAMTRTLRWYGSLPGGHAEFYQDVDNLRLAGRAALQERLEASEGRLTRIASAAVIRGRCVFCAHPDDPADGAHTSTCLVAPESDPCPYVHDSGDRCVLQFEHGGSHDLGY